MTLRIKDLFKTESAQAPEQAAIPQPQNPNNRQEGETYRHWGLRVCAIANGILALAVLCTFKKLTYSP